MKTFTLAITACLGFAFLSTAGASQALAHPPYYYNIHGDRLGWVVPDHVFYSVNRSYHDYDLVHVRRVPARGSASFEFILEKHGRFLTVYADHSGRIMRSTWLLVSPFASHYCDSHCGFHGDHYKRYYRPRPIVVRQRSPHYHGHKKGHGHKHAYEKQDTPKEHNRGDNSNEKDKIERRDDSNGYRRGRA